jgi:hypothetical protein
LGHLDRDPMKEGEDKMRSALIAAAALVALAGSAEAAARHTWYYVNYDAGACELSNQTPEEMLAFVAGPFGRGMGYEVGRISPDDVVKTGNGQIHVTLRTTLDGRPHNGEFFTSKAMCDDFVKNEQITPQSAPSGDIN